MPGDAGRLLRAVDEFLLDCRSRRLSIRTIGFYQWQLERFVAWLADEKVTAVADVTRAHVRLYLVTLGAAGWRDRSAHAAGRAARAWFRFLVDEGRLDRSPMDGVKLPRVAHDILPALSVADIDALLRSATSNRDRAIVLALLDSGCRAAEFVRLNIGDIDDGGRVTVRAGKGAKDRFTRLDARCRQALRLYLTERDGAGPDDPLWLSDTHGRGRLGVGGLQQCLRRLGARAGVANCHPHSFRRSCALFMKRAGATELECALYLGHSDLSVIRQYLALDDTDMTRVHERFGAVGSLPGGNSVPQRPLLRIVGGR